MMTMTDTMKDSSKKLSWLLRHGAASVGIPIDAAGWVAIGDVLRHLRMTRSYLDALVADNAKRRYEIEGDRIRACQGHSLGVVGADPAVIEATWKVFTADAPIWHGTAIEALPSIAREGLRPQTRTHVHLAPSLESVVGKRAQVAVMLEVDPRRVRAEGVTVYEAPNGVILARRIPAGAIVGLRPMTARARARAAEFAGLFRG